MQHLFYYRRKKCVQQLMNTANEKNCTIPIPDLTASFQNRWQVVNDNIMSSYSSPSASEQQIADQNFTDEITIEDVACSLKTMKKDTSPGPDRVLCSVLKSVKCEFSIAKLSTAILRFNHIPKSLREARTVLIYKKGDTKETKNWRPISICSVVRRVFERILERKMRQFITLNENQRGFTSYPGTFINTAIIDGVLKNAKQEKKTTCVAFLDIVQAYDHVGHLHLQKCLESIPMPSILRSCVISLTKENYTKIQTRTGVTKEIQFLRGVFQGSPLSPLLFNIAIDPVLNQ